MRNSFAKEITKLASERKDVCLLSGDIGNRMFDEFKKVAGERFLNCGIAESNMISVAAGMALKGLRPFVYTITPFTTTRCLEQIKIGIAYHEAPVIIVGTGSGLSYAELGPTHHSFEDMAIINCIPNINVLAPADSDELITFLREAIELKFPTYIRIGKKGEPNINVNNNKIGIGKIRSVIEGEKILILAIGPIINEAIKANEKYKQVFGKEISIVSVGSLKPIDKDFLLSKLRKEYKHWITLEEHNIIGGLGSVISDFLQENNSYASPKLNKLGIPDKFIHDLGNQLFVRKKLGIDSDGIFNFLKKL